MIGTAKGVNEIERDGEFPYQMPVRGRSPSAQQKSCWVNYAIWFRFLVDRSKRTIRPANFRAVDTDHIGLNLRMGRTRSASRLSVPVVDNAHDRQE